MSINKRILEAIERADLSYGEVSNKTGIAKATLFRYANGTTKKIPIEAAEKIAKVCGVSAEWIMGWSKEIEKPLAKIYRIPIYDSVSAGFGALAVNEIKDYIDLPFTTLSEAQETLCVTVRGDSMSPKIQDGDLIQVHRQDSVDSGDIAAVLLDGEEGFVKKLTYGADWIKLSSLNPAYSPITLEGADVLRCKVMGKVKKIIREV